MLSSYILFIIKLVKFLNQVSSKFTSDEKFNSMPHFRSSSSEKENSVGTYRT